MQDKTINLPYNREQFIKTHRLLWEYLNNKHLRSYFVYSAIGVIVFILGILVEEGPIPVLTIAGGAVTLYMATMWSAFLDKRSKYYKLIYGLANTYDHQQMDCSYTFTAQGIEYRDKEKQMRMAWHLFTNFTTYRDHIIIHLRNSTSAAYLIARASVSEQDYQDIYDLLAEQHEAKQV